MANLEPSPSFVSIRIHLPDLLEISISWPIPLTWLHLGKVTIHMNFQAGSVNTFQALSREFLNISHQLTTWKIYAMECYWHTLRDIPQGLLCKMQTTLATVYKSNEQHIT
jgi:hypothetical protein